MQRGRILGGGGSIKDWFVSGGTVMKRGTELICLSLIIVVIGSWVFSYTVSLSFVLYRICLI